MMASRQLVNDLQGELARLLEVQVCQPRERMIQLNAVPVGPDFTLNWLESDIEKHLNAVPVQDRQADRQAHRRSDFARSAPGSDLPFDERFGHLKRSSCKRPVRCCGGWNRYSCRKCVVHG